MKNENKKPVKPIMGNGCLGLGGTYYEMPTCPSCLEVTYSEPSCPFCGQPFEEGKCDREGFQ